MEYVAWKAKVVVYAVRRIVVGIHPLDLFQHFFDSLPDGTVPGIVLCRPIKIDGAPVLDAFFLVLVFMQILLHILGRFPDLLGDLRIFAVPQIGQQAQLIHVHGVDEAVPRDLRIELLIVGIVHDPHCPLKYVQIDPAVSRIVPVDGHFAVAEAADQIAPRLAVKRFVAGQIVCRLLKIGTHLIAEGVESVLLIPDVQVVQGHPAVVQLPDDEGLILPQQSRMEQQLMDLIGDAVVFAVGIGKQPPGKCFQLLNVGVGQLLRPAGKDKLLQKPVVFLHQLEGSDRILLDQIQYLLRRHARFDLGFRKLANRMQIFDITILLHLLHAVPHPLAIVEMCRTFRHRRKLV